MDQHSYQIKKINAFSKFILSISVLILAVAALFYSSNPAIANNLPDFIQQNGRYNVQYVTGLNAQGKFYWHVMAYNSETGNFKVYYWDVKTQNWAENFQGKGLPTLP